MRRYVIISAALVGTAVVWTIAWTAWGAGDVREVKLSPRTYVSDRVLRVGCLRSADSLRCFETDATDQTHVVFLPKRIVVFRTTTNSAATETLLEVKR